jgi:hypothetical protein
MAYYKCEIYIYVLAWKSEGKGNLKNLLLEGRKIWTRKVASGELF